jgi:hypothetical protein
LNATTLDAALGLRLLRLIALGLGITLWAGSAWAGEARWLPDSNPTAEAAMRQGPAFSGMGYLFPLRLHLSRGGTIDGGMGGVDQDGGLLLLLLSQGDLLVDFRLIVGVTPLARLGVDDGSAEGSPAPPPLRDNLPVKFRWRPTWRSHLGVVLSFLLPGLGQFIQTRDQEAGLLVLSGVLSSVAVGLLALYGPSDYGPQARRGIAGVFFGLGGAVALGGAIHAYRIGRERVALNGPRLDR